MTTPFKLTRVASLKTVADFRAHCAGLGVDLPLEDAIEAGAGNPLSQPIARTQVNGKTIGNRIAIHPMEGWDGTTSGGISEEMKRRWQRFGASGAKLICGAEAMAVRADGRANMNQLILNEENRAGITELVGILKAEHLARWGSVDDLVIGFQLTHSGRFCRPHDKKRWESRVAYRHPILDKKFNVTSDDQVLTDADVEELIRCYVRAARVARDCGADFVDIKHCHGYLGHEFLSAVTRPGRYGGSFTHRTRFLTEIAPQLEARGCGAVMGITSVAGDRGRIGNYVYGSAKAGFATYLSGYRNRMGRSGVHVLTVKPGPVDTAMTWGGPKMPFMSTPEAVVADMRAALRKRRNILYTAKIWGLIMLVIRMIPEPIFKKMNF